MYNTTKYLLSFSDYNFLQPSSLLKDSLVFKYIFYVNFLIIIYGYYRLIYNFVFNQFFEPEFPLVANTTVNSIAQVKKFPPKDAL